MLIYFHVEFVDPKEMIKVKSLYIAPGLRNAIF